MKLFYISVSFILLGLGSLLTFALSSSYVDINGFLQEPFALIPVGYFFVFLGLLGSATFGVRKYVMGKKRSK